MWREKIQGDIPVSQWTCEKMHRGQQEDDSLEQVSREATDQNTLLGVRPYMEKGLIYR